MKTSTKKQVLLWPALWLCLFLGGPVHGDDIEVFLQGAPDNATTNILFAIDTAGASNRQTVIEDITGALNTVIDQTSGNTQLGLARYYPGGGNPGSYVAYPVKSLRDTAATSSESPVISAAGDVFHDGGPAPVDGTCDGFPCEQVDVAPGDVIQLNQEVITLPEGTHERAAFVFGNVSIPRYAEVTDAYIQLHPTQAVKNNTTVDVYRLDSVNPQAFTATDTLFPASVNHTSNGQCNVDLANGDVADSFSTSAGIWQCKYGAGDRRVKVDSASDQGIPVFRLDVTELVQDAVKEVGWCGEQNLALALASMNDPDGNTGDALSFWSYDGVAAGRTMDPPQHRLMPKLVVEWSPTGADRSGIAVSASGDDWKSCSGGVRLDLQSVDNDVIDNTDTSTLDTGNILVAGDADLLFGVKTSGGGGGNGNGNNNQTSLTSGTYEIGLRFPGVNFGPDASVSNARLHYQLRQAQVDGTQGNIVVRSIAGHAEPFNGSADVSGASKSASSASFTHAQTDDNNYPLKDFYSLDVSSLVSAALSSGSWSSGSALGLVMASSTPSSYAVQLGALEDGSGSAPYITMDVLSTSPQDFLPSSRDALKQQVSLLASAQGGGLPKTAGTLADMGNYMRGDSVITGQYFYQGSTLTPEQEAWEEQIFSTEHTDYAGPISPGTCEKRHMVVLVGKAPNDHPSDYISEATDGNVTCPSGGDEYDCMAAQAKWLAEQSDPPVVTHLIAFDLQQAAATEGYKKVTDPTLGSGGEFKEASDGDPGSILRAFQEIVNKVTVENASLAAPGVAVNQLNRFEHLDQLYYSVFKPEFKERWKGNLKRYKLKFYADPDKPPELVDQTDSAAVEPDTGFFKDTSRSFWSDQVDGNSADLGGARGEIDQTGFLRPLFVSGGANPGPGSTAGARTATSPVSGTTLTEVTADNTLSATDYGLSSGADTTSAYRFVMREMGDPLHSEPRLVTYEASVDADTGAVTMDNTIFFSTNDGALHAIDGDDGSEQFVFMPKEELAETADRLDNNTLSTAPFARSFYGLDSTWTTWRFKDSSENTRVFLYGGQRRGGDNYYALDASDRANPKLLWVLDGDDSTGGEFSKLAQTWSRPTFGKVRMGTDDVPVLIFGGGYSASDHDTRGDVSDTGDVDGNAVFMVNAYTGALIWSASSASISGGGDHDTVSDMKWSIPGDISVVDLDFDGYLDHMYFSDLGGQVFRTDIKPDASGPGDLVRRTVTLARLGASAYGNDYDNHRRFYSAPTVALGKRGTADVLHVAVGSGYRAHPLEDGSGTAAGGTSVTQDRAYVIDDSNVFTANDGTFSAPTVATDSNLLDVTSDASPDASDFTGKTGWRLDFQKSIGEKMVAGAAILQGELLFTTFIPQRDENTSDCEPIAGRSRLYRVGLADGSPAIDTNNDGVLDARYEDGTVRGLASRPQPVIGSVSVDSENLSDEEREALEKDPCGGKGKLAIVQGTSVSSGGTLKGCGIQKTRWYQVENETEADDVINDEIPASP